MEVWYQGVEFNLDREARRWSLGLDTGVSVDLGWDQVWRLWAWGVARSLWVLWAGSDGVGVHRPGARSCAVPLLCFF